MIGAMIGAVMLAGHPHDPAAREATFRRGRSF
jgi:hypothetical protein